jgi:hypothetical protein
VSLLKKVTSEPGCSRSARDESGGCPLSGQAVSGM